MLIRLDQIEYGEELKASTEQLETSAEELKASVDSFTQQLASHDAAIKKTVAKEELTSQYYDKTEVDQKVAEAAAGGKVDLTEFATSEEVKQLISSDLADTLELYDKQDIANAVNNYKVDGISHPAIYNYIQENKKLPWKRIDYSYLTDASFSFGSFSGHDIVTEAPKMIGTKNIKSFRNFYAYCYELTKIEAFDDLNNCNDFYYLFAGDSKLKEIPDFPRVAYKAYCGWMFYNCSCLIKAPAIPGTIGNAGDMFYGCEKLEEIPEYDLSHCEDMTCMFYGCKSLPEEFPWAIDLSAINPKPGMSRGISSMFAYDGNTSKVHFKNVHQAFNPDNPNNCLGGSTLESIVFSGKQDVQVIIDNYLDD